MTPLTIPKKTSICLYEFQENLNSRSKQDLQRFNLLM